MDFDGWLKQRLAKNDGLPSWYHTWDRRKVHMVNVDDLNDIPAMEWERGRVAPIEEGYAAGKTLPPIRVFTGPDGLRDLEDGNHRLAIARRMGVKQIAVNFLDPDSAKSIPRPPRPPHFMEGVGTHNVNAPVVKGEAEGETRVASIAVFNEDGELLMGLRNDTGKWTLPGGHFESGETPKEAAIRELREETGIEIKKPEFLGTGNGGPNGEKEIFAFTVQIKGGKPDSSNDPDNECSEWVWVDVSGGLPEKYANNLHNPKNVTLRHLGLQGEEELSKSLKAKLLGLAAGALLSTGAMAANTGESPQHAYHQTQAAKWSPSGLSTEMYPIAHLESSWGKRMNHMPHSKGEYHTAFGAVGFKTVTAHEEYKRSKVLQKLFPDLHDETKFTEAFKSNPSFYNTLATTHFNRLKRVAGGDVTKAVYGWRWGIGKMLRSESDKIIGDPYVQAYHKIREKLNPPKPEVAPQQPVLVAKNMFERAVGEWLHKSLEERIYDLSHDKHGLVTPKITEANGGYIIEPTDFSELEEHLRSLGYHGYCGHITDPRAVYYFTEHRNA